MTKKAKKQIELLEEGIRMWETLRDKCKDGSQGYGKTKYFKDHPDCPVKNAWRWCALCDVCYQCTGLHPCRICPNTGRNGWCWAWDCALPRKGVKFAWIAKHTPEAAEYIIQSHKVLIDRIKTGAKE